MLVEQSDIARRTRAREVVPTPRWFAHGFMKSPNLVLLNFNLCIINLGD